MSTIGVPNPKPQPNKSSYPLSELELFTRYTRDTFRQAAGYPAPPCDPAKKLKCWLDSTVDLEDPEALVGYNSNNLTADGKRFKKFSISAKDAATVNLPGRGSYPPYVVKDTPAFIPSIVGGADTRIDANLLCTEAEAEALAAELGGTVWGEGSVAGTVWGTEMRREYVISVAGTNHIAASLIKRRNEAGVGVPGHWDLSGAEPQFMVDLPPDTSGKGEWPVPLRDLLGNEQADPHSPLGIPGTIIRTDLKQIERENSGMFLPEDRARLVSIEAKLDRALDN
jgi:hypothetical protein